MSLTQTLTHTTFRVFKIQMKRCRTASKKSSNRSHFEEKESKRLAEGLTKVAFCRKKHFSLRILMNFHYRFPFCLACWGSNFYGDPHPEGHTISPIDFARDVGGAPRAKAFPPTLIN